MLLLYEKYESGNKFSRFKLKFNYLSSTCDAISFPELFYLATDLVLNIGRSYLSFLHTVNIASPYRSLLARLWSSSTYSGHTHCYFYLRGVPWYSSSCELFSPFVATILFSRHNHFLTLTKLNVPLSFSDSKIEASKANGGYSRKGNGGERRTFIETAAAGFKVPHRTWNARSIKFFVMLQNVIKIYGPSRWDMAVLIFLFFSSSSSFLFFMFVCHHPTTIFSLKYSLHCSATFHSNLKEWMIFHHFLLLCSSCTSPIF